MLKSSQAIKFGILTGKYACKHEKGKECENQEHHL